MRLNALERIGQAIAWLDSAAPAAHPGMVQARDRLLEMRGRVLVPPSAEEGGALASELARMVAVLSPVDSLARAQVLGAVQAFLSLPEEPLPETEPTDGASASEPEWAPSGDDIDMEIAS